MRSFNWMYNFITVRSIWSLFVENETEITICVYVSNYLPFMALKMRKSTSYFILKVPIFSLGTTDIYRYLVSPLYKNLCFFQVLLKNTVKAQVMLYACAIMGFQYVSLTWLKNPAGINDEFFSLIVNVWIIGFSLIFNFVLFYDNSEYFTSS
jgi:hypothetical protein